VGYQAMYQNITGASNTTLGYWAGFGSTSGANNTWVGSYSGPNNGTAASNTGSYNVGIGQYALTNNTTATNNTAVGYQAGYSATIGGGNVFIGQNAGSASGVGMTTGTSNIVIGSSASASAAGDSQSITILASNSGGNGKGSSTGFINPGGGGVYQGNNSTTWSFTSDQRLKKNIVTNTDGLNKISQLTVRNFEYRLPEEVDPELKPTDALNISGVQLGFIAQELQAVLPDCVKTESTGVLGVNIDNVIYHMVNAIKDLNTLVTAQATEIEALKAKVGV
jgi:hypothetical protein